MSRRGVTIHRIVEGDARHLSSFETESVHLVCTSPLDRSLKTYPDHKAQSGNSPVDDELLEEMDLSDSKVPFRLG
jgi:hypothetical protein